MSGKASSDFGLYRERQQQNHLKSLKLVLVIGVMAASGMGILYFIVHLARNSYHSDNPLEVTIEKPSQSQTNSVIEKLIPAESLKRELSPAMPFALTYRGDAPAEFSPSTVRTTTPSNYPQLEVYRHQYYPKNIQDVIGYTMPKPLKRPPTTNDQRIQVRFHNPQGYKESSSQKNFTYADNRDPFYSYKPEDPSDVNLMAIASFRFAPPYWSSNNAKQKVFRPQQELENVNTEEIYRAGHYQNHNGLDLQKPMIVTLNIYPDHGDVRGGRLFRSQLESLDPRLKIGGSKVPRKMLIRLNVYPERGQNSVGSDFRETKLHKNMMFPTA